MSLRRTGAITRRLLAQFRHDHRTVAILFVAPLVILTLFYFLFSEQGRPADLGLHVEQSSQVTTVITDVLADADRVVLREGTREDLETALEAGDIDGYLVLPADLAQQLASGTVRPELHLRGTDPTASAAILQTVAQTFPRALGMLVAPGAGGPPALEVEPIYRFGGPDLGTLDLIGSPFIGLLVFFLVYLVTAISFLRERSLGTLERLMASPLRRSEIVLGYMAGFTLIALVQAAEVLVFSIWLLNLYNAGNVLLIFGVEALLALAAINLGIFLSTFARNEFQAVQFIPLVIVPQILLSGVIVPVSSEPDWMQVLSNALPLTYAVDALKAIMLEGRGLESGRLLLDVGVLAGVNLVLLLAAARTLRRTIA